MKILLTIIGVVAIVSISLWVAFAGAENGNDVVESGAGNGNDVVESGAEDGNDVVVCKPDGLSPDFWKNHTEAWYDLSPDTRLEALFDVPDIFGLDDYTTLEALKFEEGPGEIGTARILLKAAVAAYLNSESEDTDLRYYLGAGTVLDLTNSALASMDTQTMLSQKSEFEYNNNLGIQI